jgi:hypothetical protein
MAMNLLFVDFSSKLSRPSALDKGDERVSTIRVLEEHTEQRQLTTLPRGWTTGWYFAKFIPGNGSPSKHIPSISVFALCTYFTEPTQISDNVYTTPSRADT